MLFIHDLRLKKKGLFMRHVSRVLIVLSLFAVIHLNSSQLHAALLFQYAANTATVTPNYQSQTFQNFASLPFNQTTSVDNGETSASVTLDGFSLGTTETYKWSHFESTKNPYYGNSSVYFQLSFMVDRLTSFALTNTWSNNGPSGSASYGTSNAPFALGTFATIYDFGVSPFNTITPLFFDSNTAMSHSGFFEVDHYYAVVASFEVHNNTPLFGNPSPAFTASGELTLTATAVPEPSSALLICVGAAATGVIPVFRKKILSAAD
jgi:hypothetical protein